jgi:hypothetical protein
MLILNPQGRAYGLTGFCRCNAVIWQAFTDVSGEATLLTIRHIHCAPSQITEIFNYFRIYRKLIYCEATSRDLLDYEHLAVCYTIKNVRSKAIPVTGRSWRPVWSRQ